MANWDERFLALAKHVAQWSKDPSTKTGCVIAAPDRRVVSLGFNGFPRGVADDARLQDRETKYKMVVHAEANAILLAGGRLLGCTAYLVPWPPCAPCAGKLIQVGIARVVAQTPTEEQIARWGQDFVLMKAMFDEAGVLLDLVSQVV